MIFRILIKNSFDPDLAWSELSASGCEVLYSSEEDGVTELILKTTKKKLTFPFIESCEPYELPETDYVHLWELHAEHFIDGKVHLPLPDGKHILLAPGAGFGDLSHPTTNLCLELMADHVKGQKVIDIGSGSGVLTLAALALGAKEAIGIDIDPAAIRHAQENAELNDLNAKFYLPGEWEPAAGSYIILMNMISSEQEVAWKSFEGKVSGTLILSGILAEQKDEYAKFAERFGWEITECVEKDGWLGLVATI